MKASLCVRSSCLGAFPSCRGPWPLRGYSQFLKIRVYLERDMPEPEMKEGASFCNLAVHHVRQVGNFAAGLCNRRFQPLHISFDIRKAACNSGNVLEVCRRIDFGLGNRLQCRPRSGNHTPRSWEEVCNFLRVRQAQHEFDRLQGLFAACLHQLSEGVLFLFLGGQRRSFAPLHLGGLPRTQVVGRENCDHRAYRLHPASGISASFGRKAVGLSTEEDTQKADGGKEPHGAQYRRYSKYAEITLQVAAPFQFKSCNRSATGVGA